MHFVEVARGHLSKKKLRAVRRRTNKILLLTPLIALSSSEWVLSLERESTREGRERVRRWPIPEEAAVGTISHWLSCCLSFRFDPRFPATSTRSEIWTPGAFPPQPASRSTTSGPSITTSALGTLCVNNLVPFPPHSTQGRFETKRSDWIRVDPIKDSECIVDLSAFREMLTADWIWPDRTILGSE